jgi:hypothetical protein
VVGKAELQGYMKSENINGKEVAATANYELKIEDTGFAVDWAYGLTKSWMIGFQVPLALRKVIARSDISLTPVLARGVKQNFNASTRSISDSGLRQKVQDLSQNELTTSGYDVVPTEKTGFEWEDVTLLSQFQILNTYHWVWSLQQQVRIPSVRNPSSSDYLVMPNDEGQLDLGLASLIDLQFKRWTLGFHFGYVMQTPDSTHIRTFQMDSLRAGKPGLQDVHRDLGDWAWAAADVDLHLSQSLDFNSGYGYLIKNRDHYSGDTLTPEQADFLSENSDQEIHRVNFRLRYQFTDLRVRDSIESKWLVSLGYDMPLFGRNSVDAGRAILELTSYFYGWLS